MKDETIVVVVALVGILTYGALAILKGLDSSITATVSASIGTILGYYFGKRKKEEK